jgi:hypothetical protein
MLLPVFINRREIMTPKQRVLCAFAVKKPLLTIVKYVMAEPWWRLYASIQITNNILKMSGHI